MIDALDQGTAACATQRLVLGANAYLALQPAGLSLLPIQHEDCRQRSRGEARVVRSMWLSLLDSEVIDRRGRRRRMTLDDVLIVAKYNIHVNHLCAVLPEGTRVGTVDKFQSHKAEVVIASMATSGADDMPRDAFFLPSRNRLNVAISRAHGLAVLVASQGHRDLVAQSVEEVKLANLVYWAADYAARNLKLSAAKPSI